MAFKINRRRFLTTLAALGAVGTLTGCPRRWVTIWRRSGKGRRTSNASDSHSANILYSTWIAAFTNPAHPGDRAKIVPLTISQIRYNELFGFSGSASVDLRHL